MGHWKKPTSLTWMGEGQLPRRRRERASPRKGRNYTGLSNSNFDKIRAQRLTGKNLKLGAIEMAQKIKAQGPEFNTQDKLGRRRE